MSLMPGLIVVAKWRGSDVLDTILTWTEGQVDRVTSEVSADGSTLTSTAPGNLGSK
jgi:hypothetical protein